MQTTTGLTLKMTRSACKTAAAKGLDAHRLLSIFNSPSAVIPNPRREGQFRITGDGFCLVGVPAEDDTFLVITITKGY